DPALLDAGVVRAAPELHAGREAPEQLADQRDDEGTGGVPQEEEEERDDDRAPCDAAAEGDEFRPQRLRLGAGGGNEGDREARHVLPRFARATRRGAGNDLVQPEMIGALEGEEQKRVVLSDRNHAVALLEVEGIEGGGADVPETERRDI